LKNPGSQPKEPVIKKEGFHINKFVIGGALILVAVVLLTITSLKGNAQYYLTVSELLSGKTGRAGNVRISGVVLGETIKYDPQKLLLSFTIASIPGDTKTIDRMGGLAAVLHNTALDPTADRLQVVYHGVKPDLLKNEAQAIMTGSLDPDGVFIADELLLKCPSRYEDSIPAQTGS
jgi:cytochrome c-type biogenesis protein CcmE